MPSATITLTVETLERIIALGGDDHEATIIAALDALEHVRTEASEAERFWAQAEAAAAWRASLSDGERARLADDEAKTAAALDGIR